MKGFEPLGLIFPFKGELYNGVGGEKARTFRWSQDKFLQLSDVEAKALDAEQKRLGEYMERDCFKKEGWQKHDPIFNVPSGVTNIPICLRTDRLNLVLKKSENRPPFSVITIYLEEPGDDQATALLEIDGGWRMVDFAEYSKYVK
jgi:hypothetical protein